MLRLRKTIGRMRRRHNSDTGEESDTKKKKKKFPKMRLKFKFLQKFRHEKKPTEDESEKAETEVSVPMKAAYSEDNILSRSQSDGDINSNGEVSKLPVNGDVTHDIVINVDCHENPDRFNECEDEVEEVPRRPSLSRLTPDRLSRSSFGLGPLSRASMISQKSASNISMCSMRKPEVRTIWTQTELTETVATIQTSTENMLTVPGTAEQRSESMTSEKVSEFETPWTSMEFGVDDLARRGVENPVLAAQRDRIVLRLACPDLDFADAELCVELLRCAKIPYLTALNRKISTEGGIFNEQFIASRGLDFLLILMEEIANGGLMTLFDVTKMLLVSECATALVNSPTGKDYIINHGEHVVSLARGKNCDQF